MRLGIFAIFLSALFGLMSCVSSSETACKVTKFQGASFTICRYDAKTQHIRTYLNDLNGKPYANFAKLKAGLGVQGKTLIFAMNGGMYHDDRSAVGLYIEGGKQYQNINTNKGPGNFHMLPNGVFYMGHQSAGVVESSYYLRANIAMSYATQSGPMLVIGGKLHPKFGKNSKSKNIRNGVGVKGDIVTFVISNDKVNFHTFASLFKDHLNIDNALYLDGVVSKIYAPELARNDFGLPMGPIIAVVGETP